MHHRDPSLLMRKKPLATKYAVQHAVLRSNIKRNNDDIIICIYKYCVRESWFLLCFIDYFTPVVVRIQTVSITLQDLSTTRYIYL